MLQCRPDCGKRGGCIIQKVVGVALLIFLTTILIPGYIYAQKTLDKISRTGKFVVGARHDDMPVGYINEKGEWVGFGLDLARELHKKLKENLGKDIELPFLPVNPRIRISMLVGGEVDIVCDTTAHTIRRDQVVDFSITWQASGIRLLTEKGSPIRQAESLGGKKVGAVQRSSAERVICDLIDRGIIRPPVRTTVFPDHAQGFLALQQGIIDAYCANEIVLAGIKAKAPDPSRWEVVGRLMTHDLYGFMVRANDSGFRDFVNFSLIEMIRSGKFIEIYDRWHGPKGVAPMPMNKETQILLKLQSWPY